MADPELLIFDEPTNGLDFIAREQFLETIEKIAQKQNAPTYDLCNPSCRGSVTNF